MGHVGVIIFSKFTSWDGFSCCQGRAANDILHPPPQMGSRGLHSETLQEHKATKHKQKRDSTYQDCALSARTRIFTLFLTCMEFRQCSTAIFRWTQ